VENSKSRRETTGHDLIGKTSRVDLSRGGVGYMGQLSIIKKKKKNNNKIKENKGKKNP
jgi:hypothetical protein